MKKILTFTLVGIVGAFFDYGTRTLLLHVGVLGFLARGCSYIVGSTVAYYLNSYFTFNGNRSRTEKARAAAVYCLCFTAAVLVDLAIRKQFPEVPHVLLWSWVFSQAVATVLNFLLQNFWVFNNPTQTEATPASHRKETP
ncbi:GtrA family protein [Corynebacterium sp. 320]|uniref:GtrA family protein n=1 Tax=Corynebacterium TaxID=1716 RepID=UPI00125CA898|nr:MULTISPECIES: GtrA family protein [Corynebacterium]KAB1504368.1 GtrA family protein [Corynebacterium sp. 320]KAB1552534.1 GtrA family protein [Corynebacterium sp. 321]KAB3528504.1 GtrA family protein [Corynebacterium sp. 250]QNP92047.1 GtrA family protein [Corynebacterium zhongnanshanii]